MLSSTLPFLEGKHSQISRKRNNTLPLSARLYAFSSPVCVKHYVHVLRYVHVLHFARTYIDNVLNLQIYMFHFRVLLALFAAL